MKTLNDNQLKQLAGFSSNLGLVFAATVVTPLFSGIQSVNLLDIIPGVGLALIFLVISLMILEKVKK